MIKLKSFKAHVTHEQADLIQKFVDQWNTQIRRKQMHYTLFNYFGR